MPSSPTVTSTARRPDALPTGEHELVRDRDLLAPAMPPVSEGCEFDGWCFDNDNGCCGCGEMGEDENALEAPTMFGSLPR